MPQVAPFNSIQTLAQAHVILARLVGENTPEGITHLRRAVALDGRSAEGLMWLGHADSVSGRFAEGLAAYRRAHEVDPLWPVPVRVLVDINSMLGDRVPQKPSSGIGSGRNRRPETSRWHASLG